MTRRMRLLVHVGLLGVLGVLAFPGAGSALAPTYTISLTSSGPSPEVLSTPASYGHLRFDNTDTVSHTVTFANGSCSADIAPDDHFDCGNLLYVGKYPYTVDGSTQAKVVVTPADRSVSLHARRHAVRPGSWVTLHGTLTESSLGGPPGGGAQPIIVAARPYPGHPHCRIGVVQATVHRTKQFPFGYVSWHLRIRPRVGMTYIAVASSQLKGGQVWERAVSQPFRVDVRR